MIAEHPVHITSRQNARTWGNRFESRFLEAGIVSYEDSGGDKELLRHETIERCAQTFVGRPVIIRHSKVSPATMEEKAQGYISRVWFNPADGWFYCEGIITGDEAKSLINNGWSVSCSYRVTDTYERPGKYHNISYARELTAFDGEHLALVQQPRYESANIRLNSKNIMFKLLRKILARDNAAASETQEEVSAESVVDLGNGKTVTVGDLVKRYNESSAPAVYGTVERKENESDEDYKNRCASIEEEKRKENEAKEAKEKEEKERKENEAKAEAEEKERKENALKAEADAKAAQERENALKIEAAAKEAAAQKERDNAAFKTLAAAASTTTINVDRSNSAETEADMLARGRQRYGSGHGKN